MSTVATRALADVSDDELVAIALSGMGAGSARTYAKYLARYARYRRTDSAGSALRELIGLDVEQAKRLLSKYQASMKARRLEPATIQSRMSAFRSAIRKLHAAGLTALDLDAESADRERDDAFLASFLAGLTPLTAANYKSFYNRYARYRRTDSAGSALRELIGLDVEQAKRLLSKYQASMKARRLEPATIKESMYALRSAIRLARKNGWTELVPEISFPYPHPRRERLEIVPDGYVSIAVKGKKPGSARKSLQDYSHFARLMGFDSAEDALHKLCGLRRAPAHRLVAEYRERMEEARKAPATIASRLSGLTVAIDKLRKAGYTELALDIDLPEQTEWEGSREPAELHWRRLIDTNDAQLEAEKSTVKNLAVFLTLRYLLSRERHPLRKIEALKFSDVDINMCMVRVGESWRPVNRRCVDALAAWLELRGDWEGPLFTRGKNGARGWGRLSASGVWKLLLKIGHRLGMSGPELRLAGLIAWNGDAESPESTEPAVVLFESYKRQPLIGGKAKRALSPSDFDVVKAMIQYKHLYMDRNELAKRSGVRNPEVNVSRLRRDSDWHDEIECPGLDKQGAYRVPRGTIRPNPPS